MCHFCFHCTKITFSAWLKPHISLPPFTTKYPYLHPKIFVELIRFFIHMLKTRFLPKALSAYQQLFCSYKNLCITPLISTFSFTPSKKTIIEKMLYALFRLFILMKKARFDWLTKKFHYNRPIILHLDFCFVFF